MHKDQITEALKKHESIKFAIDRYEQHRSRPFAGSADYDGLPSGSGAPERLFAPQGKMADMGHATLADAIDYEIYKTASNDIEASMGLLSRQEKMVIERKWMDGVSLNQIAKDANMPEITVKRTHKMALDKLGHCLRFTPFPEITDIPGKGGEHKNRQNRTGMIP